MKTGVTRPIDDTGRIVIPKEIRKQMNLEKGVLMGFDICDGKLVLEKYIQADSYKHEVERLRNFITSDKHLSKDKMNSIENLLSRLIDELSE